jgi:squalene-hopene/tetraprenyl-beta-curcumene cyclase
MGMMKVNLKHLFCWCAVAWFCQGSWLMAEASQSFKDLLPELSKSRVLAVDYLKSSQKNGQWLRHPGVSALCLQAILGSDSSGSIKKQAWVRKAFDDLLSLQQDDGSFFDPKSRMKTKNYNTALAILALVADDPAKHKASIAKAQKFLVDVQTDEGEGYVSDEDYFYGGIGYGGDERPDLSNLQLALEALKASGLPEDHPAYKKALIFVQRCHDVEGNEMSWSGASGGFAYSPDLPSNAELPSSQGKKEVQPYGSMTFAGLKSLIFCNVEKSDPRIQQTLLWVGRNFSVSEHPNFGQSSIYYYFQTMAKSLMVADLHRIKTPEGQEIDWKLELSKELLKRQTADGKWVNSSKKYMEGFGELCTAYALNAINSMLGD